MFVCAVRRCSENTRSLLFLCECVRVPTKVVLFVFDCLVVCLIV